LRSISRSTRRSTVLISLVVDLELERDLDRRGQPEPRLQPAEAAAAVESLGERVVDLSLGAQLRARGRELPVPVDEHDRCSRPRSGLALEFGPCVRERQPADVDAADLHRGGEMPGLRAGEPGAPSGEAAHCEHEDDGDGAPDVPDSPDPVDGVRALGHAPSLGYAAGRADGFAGSRPERSGLDGRALETRRRLVVMPGRMRSGPTPFARRPPG
jgi:hypothetical protein